MSNRGSVFFSALEATSSEIIKANYSVVIKELADYTKKFEPLMKSFSDLECDHIGGMILAKCFITVFHEIILMNFQRGKWEILPSLIEAACSITFFENKAYLQDIIEICAELVKQHMGNKDKIPDPYDSFESVFDCSNICILEPEFVDKIFSVFVDLKAKVFAYALIDKLTTEKDDGEDDNVRVNSKFYDLLESMNKRFEEAFPTPKLEQKSGSNPGVAGMFSGKDKLQLRVSEDNVGAQPPEQKRQCRENISTTTVTSQLH